MTRSRELAAATHVLQDPLIWTRVAQFVAHDDTEPRGIEFTKLLEGPYRTFSTGEQLLVLAALDLWNGHARAVEPTFGLHSIVAVLSEKHVFRIMEGMLILGGYEREVGGMIFQPGVSYPAIG